MTRKNLLSLTRVGMIGFLGFMLTGCKPDKLTLEIYSSDVEIAATGQEIIGVPVTAEFMLLGEDEEGVLDQVIELSKKYLSPDSKYSKSKAMLGERLVIETKLPMTTFEGIEQSPARVAALIVRPGETVKYRIDLMQTQNLENFAEELQDINLLLGLSLPASETVIRVISDSRKTVKVKSIAVFVSKKPYLIFERDLNRRDSIDIVYPGGDGSVYSEIDPLIGIDFKQ